MFHLTCDTEIDVRIWLASGGIGRLLPPKPWNSFCY